MNVVEPTKPTYKRRTSEESARSELVPIQTSALWSIQWTEGGVMPRDLEGLFTSKNDAEQAIQSYMLKANPPRKRPRRPPFKYKGNMGRPIKSRDKNPRPATLARLQREALLHGNGQDSSPV